MCHHIPVMLSAEEKQAVRRLSGFLVPAYAVLALAVIAGVAFTHHAPERQDRFASVPAASSR